MKLNRSLAWWSRALAIGLFLIAAILGTAGAATIEPTIIPSAYSTLAPTSAIQAPLRLSAAQTSVWRSDQEQRMLLSGGVNVSIGYRLLSADDAAVWLTPSRESGEAVYDVAIYLAGNVQVREGNSPSATTTRGKELLVTTRVSQNIQLSGALVSKSEEDSPLVKRGDEIRQDLLSRRLAPYHIPQIVITPAEEALQSGWIARGPNNRIIPGPGDIQVVRDAQGNIIKIAASQPGAVKTPRPRPNIFATGDDYRMMQVGKEMVYILPGAYLFYDSQDGKPPLEFRAQRMVVFSPATAEPTATAPATTRAAGPSAPVSGTGSAKDITQVVTGVYLEGDVTLDQGEQVMVRAERIYYDFTTQRAIMLDATLASVDTTRNVPVYLRAAEIRQLARGEYAAKNVEFSTSEFYTPHYHIGASQIYLRDISPELSTPNAGAAPGSGFDLATSGGLGDKTYQYQIKDATINVNGTSIFYWPFLSGDTSNNDIPLRTGRISNSKTFGVTLQTDWDIFALTNQQAPPGLRADLTLDYFGKRGPGAGVQSQWQTDEDNGLLRSYIMRDYGQDRLGYLLDSADNVGNGVDLLHHDRDRLSVREQHDLGDGWTLQLEGAYLSDPNFLAQYFPLEFNTDKEKETSLYLKKQDDTSVLSFLGKWDLMDFTTVADQVDDQFTTNKQPEVKYWRIGDSLLDLFTYYSETSVDDLHMDITNLTPDQLGFRQALLAASGTLTGAQLAQQQAFLGVPAAVVPHNQTFRQYLMSQGWNTGDVFRGDTRQEIDMPLQVGDAKIVPYATGRVTYWDTGFPDAQGGTATSSTTTRLWGGGGIRSSMQFWKVYDDANSIFFDVHRLRHIIEPQFNVFVGGTDVNRNDLQPFDRSVEGITGASGTQLAINQKWETKRGGEGHWRDVDWIILNISWNQFWNQDKTGNFLYQQPLRGFFFPSRPDLSLDANSINADWVWRAGERMRFLGDADYNLDTHNVEQAAAGVAVDQTDTLSYFFGNRYIHVLETDEWTIAMDYQLTKKYELIAAEAIDSKQGKNILTSFTLVRKMPRFNFALSVSYDANNSDTSYMVEMWPEGIPSPLGTQADTGIGAGH